MSEEKLNFEYGPDKDIERLKLLGDRGGQDLCKLNKMPNGHLTSLLDASICDISQPVASTVTARYYKGIGAHKDNMVIEIWKIEKPN